MVGVKEKTWRSAQVNHAKTCKHGKTRFYFESKQIPVPNFFSSPVVLVGESMAKIPGLRSFARLFVNCLRETGWRKVSPDDQ